MILFYVWIYPATRMGEPNSTWLGWLWGEAKEKQNPRLDRLPVVDSIMTTKRRTIIKIPFYNDSSSNDTSYASSWWEPYVDHVATTFVPVDGYHWCIPSHQSDNHPLDGTHPARGLLFVKNHKSASSTGAGITTRIAHKVGERYLQYKQTKQQQQQQRYPTDTSHKNSNNKKYNTNHHYQPICSHHANHAFADARRHVHRQSPHLLWTIVRHPTARVLSGYSYFRGGVQPMTYHHLRMYAQSEKSSQFKYLQTSDDTTRMMMMTTTTTMKLDPTHIPLNHVAEWMKEYILDSYHFIALADRMDESLVVMKLLWGLDEGDIIVLPSKTSGTYDRGPDGKCRLLLPSQSSSSSSSSSLISTRSSNPAIQDYLDTDFVQNNYDFLLYAAVNQSLQRTIDSLGQDLVAQHVQRHRKLQQLVEDKCRSKVIFPCSNNGTRQVEASKLNCYHWDWGCGYPCIDQVLDEYKQQGKEQQQQQQQQQQPKQEQNG